MKRTLGLALALAVVGCAHVPSDRFVMGPPSGALDGKAYEITVVAGKAQQTDRVRFEMGSFSSVARDDDNFRPAIYSTEKKGGTVHFRSQAKSSTDGTNNWTGTVRGDAIEGMLVWIDKQGKSTEFHFRGRLAAPTTEAVAGVGQSP
jgi:hypothetical protein